MSGPDLASSMAAFLGTLITHTNSCGGMSPPANCGYGRIADLTLYRTFGAWGDVWVRSTGTQCLFRQAGGAKS